MLPRVERLVSIIIPNYNYANYLAEAIESALSQNYPRLEVFVVDDGSSDNSLEVLKEFYGSITVINSRRQGSSAARNLGMLYSSGELIAFLDSDDVWLPGKIESQVRHLEKTDADLVFSGMQVLDGSEPLERVFQNEPLSHSWFLKNPGSTPFAPSTVLMTRSLAAKVGGWNTSLTGPAEDFDFFRRCAKFGKIEYLEEVHVLHRQHAQSLTAASSERYFQDNLRALRLMLAEDRRDFSVKERLGVWLKFHYSFMKHAIKLKDCLLAILVVRHLFKG